MKRATKKKARNIRITIDLPIKFPEHWNKDEIEFYLNESGYCCDDLIEGLQKYSREHGCICDITKCEVVE